MAVQKQNSDNGTIGRTYSKGGKYQLGMELREERRLQGERRQSVNKKPSPSTQKSNLHRFENEIQEKYEISTDGPLIVTALITTILAVAIAVIHYTYSNSWSILLYFLLGVIVTLATVRTYFIQKKYFGIMFKKDQEIQELRETLKKKTMRTDYHDRQLKHLIESTNVCPWNADLTQNTFTYVGPQMISMTGIGVDEWAAKGYLLDHVMPEDRKVWLNSLRNLRSGGFVTLEYRMRSQDGKIIWLRNSFCLVSSHDKSDRLVQGFVTDITEQKNVEVALKQARYAAEKASQTKSNFLASMSHELRTPLNSIIGFAEIMCTEAFGTLGNPQYKEYSENIHSSGKHLLDLINDVLDFSKIEAGKFDVIKEPVDLRDIFKSCEMLLRERAQRSELSLLMLAPESELMIEGDPKRLKQVFINLLTNSIKFTKPGGTVTLKYEITEDNHLVIHIIDTGIGIKPEDLGSVFDKFHQVDAEKNRDQEGTGLGLSISKSLAEMHDGVFSISSVYGHGTTIKVTFPPAMIIDPKYNQKDSMRNIPKDDDDDDFISKLQSM